MLKLPGGYVVSLERMLIKETGAPENIGEMFPKPYVVRRDQRVSLSGIID